MLNRLSVSTLLKAVILATSFCVVVGFSLNAWDSWRRLQVASRMGKPKASRRPTLAKEYTETTNALLETLDKLSGTLPPMSTTRTP